MVRRRSGERPSRHLHDAGAVALTFLPVHLAPPEPPSLVEIDDIEALHAELRDKRYPFMNPGIGPRGAGREMELLDPAANQIRFFQRGRHAEP